MTFLQIKNLVQSRAGEQGYFETGTSGLATDARLVAEIQAAYENAINILDEHNAYVVFDEENLYFASGVNEIDLSDTYDTPADPPVKLTQVPRKLLCVHVYPNNDTAQEPIEAYFPRRGDRRYARKYRYRLAFPLRTATQSNRLMYLKGHYGLGFLDKGTTSQTVQVGYAPVAEALSADGDIPAQVPRSHHEYIAQRAAVNLVAAEGGDVRGMVSILDDLEEKLRMTAGNMNQFSYKIIGF